MKILQVISQLSDFMGDSGQVLLIAKVLQKMGHEVTIVTTDGDPFIGNKENSERYARTRKILLENKGNITSINGIPVYSIHCIAPRFGMYSPSAASIAEKIVREYDVIHIYSWYHHLAFVFYEMAHKYQIPFFVSMWGTLQPEAHRFNKNRKWILDILYTHKMISRVTGLHSIGISETNEYIKWGCEPSKIHYVDNGVVLENFEIKKKTNIHEKIGIPENQKYLLYLGRIHEKKGIELMLQAFKKLLEKNNDLMLIVSGTGSQGYVTKLLKFTEELNLQAKVKFTGFVSEEEKLEILKNARIFVLTSYSDIHPRAIQEALVMGIPVVITKSCDYPEVEEYESGMTVEPNIDSIFNALKEMLENEEKLLTYSNNAKKLMNDKFLLSEQVKKFEHMYLIATKNMKNQTHSKL